MRITEKKMTFGLVVGTRNIFNSAMAVQARKDVIAKVDQLGLGYVIPPVETTPNGAVESRADAVAYADHFRRHQDDIDGIVVILPNFGDEIGIVETLHGARLNVPVLVQACNDEIDKVDIRSRRDAFCGKLSICNNLYQYGIPFTDTTFHSCDIDGDAFTADLRRFAAVCRTVKGLKTARIGALGARTRAFQTVRYSEKIFQATGITVITADLSEIIFAAQALPDSEPAVKAKIDALRAYGHIPASIPLANILKQAKLTATVERWMDDNGCDASTIQCWTSIQENFGCATCATMSMMGERLMPSACEVDVAGAVSMYALTLASGTPSALLDWNNNYGYEADKCVCTHCSNYPRSFMGNDLEISNLDILGATIGPEKCFGAIKGSVAPGEMTYFRILTDDTKGRVKSYLGEGEFTADAFGMDGGIAVCHVTDMRRLLKHLCANGFEHHVAMVRGHIADVVEEAVIKYLGWSLYRHGGNE
jgi:L-fucose isomerase-like protein